MNKVVVEVKRMLTDDKILKKAIRTKEDILVYEEETEVDYEEEDYQEE